jgi:hypothetical protein
MSGSGLGVVGALVGGVILGVVFTPAPIPDTKIIAVDKPAKVIVRKEVDTKIVREPLALPESCATAADIAKATASLANKVHRNNEKAYARIDGLDLASMSDPEANIKMQVWMGERLKVSSRDLWALLEVGSALESYSQACDRDQKAAADGEEVVFSDNQPFYVPGLY